MNKQYQLLVVKIDNSELILDEVREQCTYDDVYNLLMGLGSDCRYLVHELKENETDNTGNLLFMSWVPDNAKVGDRMLYASSKSALLLKLQGMKYKIDCNDLSDATKSEVKKNRKKF